MRWILDGRKTIEVRVAYGNIARLKPGDPVLLNDQYPFVIRRIARYANFAELLAHEDPCAIAPDLSTEQLLTALQRIRVRAPDKESLGVVALELNVRRNS